MDSCHRCGVALVLEAVPGNSRKTSLPGKHCPVCDEPLDELAIESSPVRHGSSHAGRSSAQAANAGRRRALGLDEAEGEAEDEPEPKPAPRRAPRRGRR